MDRNDTPESVVQRQLEAYNARDLEAWAGTYAEGARQFEHPGTLLASGRDAIRNRMAERFRDERLHARLVKRAVMGEVVVDQEVVTRTFPDGPGRADLVAVYVVRDGFIQSASFHFGAVTPG